MTQDLAVSISNLTKSYRLFDSHIDRLKEALHPMGKKYHRNHLALNNISFDIPKGSTLGILGRNGAGKSTLLELITGVLEPTSGNIAVNGNIAALLELGAGFNPELTGRENLMANAPIRGMTRREMEKKVPEIEDFANIGGYIDQPVKSYSSGMFVRLAFAMSVCVDPDIMIIDEALAVGDARFQEKCFRRLREFKRAGKTFIIVSHAPEAMAQLCDTVIVLENGRIDYKGGPREALSHYGKLLFGESAVGGSDIRSVTQDTGKTMPEIQISDSDPISLFVRSNNGDKSLASRAGYNECEMRSGNKEAEIVDYVVLSEGRLNTKDIGVGAAVDIMIRVLFKRDVESPRVSISLRSPNGLLICGVNTSIHGLDVPRAYAGETRVFRFSFINKLGPGDYMLSFGVVDKGIANPIKLDVRESIAVLSSRGTPSFNGIVNLEFCFDSLSS